MPVAVQSAFVSALMLLSAAEELAREEEQRMESCLTRLETDPAGAYEDGLTWLSESNRAYARHCTALALIELGHAAEAAARLESLANAPDGGTVEARAIFLSQAGNAWLLARNPEAAEVALTSALKLSKDDPESLKDRARARLLLEKWAEAENDLSAALYLKAHDVDALRMRAEARLNQDDRQGAYEDVQIARELAPDNVDVLVLRGRVREAQRLAGER